MRAINVFSLIIHNKNEIVTVVAKLGRVMFFI